LRLNDIDMEQSKLFIRKSKDCKGRVASMSDTAALNEAGAADVNFPAG
jgi:hypothetical protein